MCEAHTARHTQLPTAPIMDGMIWCTWCTSASRAFAGRWDVGAEAELQQPVAQHRRPPRGVADRDVLVPEAGRGCSGGQHGEGSAGLQRLSV